MLSTLGGGSQKSILHSSRCVPSTFSETVLGSVGALILCGGSSLTRVSSGPPRPLISAPPSATLLLTCQRVHAEASVLFVEAYQRYCAKDLYIDLQDIWSKDELVAYLDLVPTDYTSTFKLSIPHARVAFSFRSKPPIEVTMSHTKGGQWRATATRGTTSDVDAKNTVLNVINSYLQRLRAVKYFCRVCMGPCGNKTLVKSQYVRPYIETKSSRKCNRAMKKAMKYRRKVAYLKSKSEWNKKAAKLHKEHKRLRRGPEGPLHGSDLYKMLCLWVSLW